MVNPSAMSNKIARRAMAERVDRRSVPHLLARLWTYISVYRWKFIFALVFVMISNGLALVGPVLLGKAIGVIGDTPGLVDFALVLRYVVLLVVLYAVSAVFAYFQAIFMIKLSQSVVSRMRRDVFDKLSSLPVGYFDRRQTGDIISVFSYDINTISESLSGDVIAILSSIITVVGSFIMMLTLKPVLVLVFVLTVPLSIVFTNVMSRIVRPRFRRRSEALGEMNGYAEEMLGGRKTISAYHREEQVNDRFSEKNSAAATAYKRAVYLGTTTGPMVNFINNLSLTLVGVVGALMLFSGSLSISALSSFILYSRKFSGPINEMANLYADLQSAVSASERVFRLIDEAPEPTDAPDAVALTDARGDVEFRNVSFGYDSDRLILRDFSLKIPGGTVVAIVGPTGAGKTTIINLLMRFYDVTSGSILIDGRPFTDYTRNSLRAAFTMVLQDTWLFGGTIFDNIAYGSPGATREQVIEAARAAKIHSFISHLPQGYDTVLTEDGLNISKGQKQLLTIARAMLAGSSMLILDEATSNVDTSTERRIQAAMQSLMEGKTSFVIAHRLSTIEHADLILVIDGGSIVEQGTHSQLISRDGHYRRLYYSQFEEN